MPFEASSTLKIAYEAEAHPVGTRWSYCMVGLTMSAPMIVWCPLSMRQDFAP
jgi:hypothetical protein